MAWSAARCDHRHISSLAGFWFALAIALIAGGVQGSSSCVYTCRSVGVSLGGLLVFVGIAFVLAANRSLPYDNLGVALLLNERSGGHLLHSQYGRPASPARR